MKWHSWLIIAVLALVLLAIDVVGAWSWFAFFSDNWQIVLAFVLGLCVAQVNLIAIWAALAPGRVMLRLPWCVFLAALMWYALVLGSYAWEVWQGNFSRYFYRSSINMGDAIVLGLIILAGVVSVQIPLWAMSRWFGWRLLPPGGQTVSREDERQFNLKHLIAGMVLASVTLGLGRAVLPAEEWTTPSLDDELMVILPAILIVNLIAIVPCIWIAFVRPALLLPLTFAWLIGATVTSVVEIAILSVFLGPPPGNVWVSFTVFNLAQGLCVLVSLLALRSAGFRLVRWHETEKNTQAALAEKRPSDIIQPGEVPSTSTITAAEQRL